MKVFLTWTIVAGAALALILGLRSVGAAAKSRSTRWPEVLASPDGAIRVRSADGAWLRLDRAPRAILPGNAAFVDFLTVLVGPERVRAVPAASDEYSRLRGAGEELAGWRDLPRYRAYGAEDVLPFEPDLVLVHEWQKPEVASMLRSAEVPVCVLPMPRSWGDVETTLRVLGVLLGAEDDAEALIESQRARIEGLRRRTEALELPGLRALSYTNLGTGGTVAGANTTADVLFGLAGLENAAAAAGLVEYQGLDLEGLLRLDPDVIVVDGAHSDAHAPPTAAYLRGQEGLRGLRALREERLVSLSTELFTTTSQELLRAAETLVAELERRR